MKPNATFYMKGNNHPLRVHVNEINLEKIWISGNMENGDTVTINVSDISIIVTHKN